MRSSTRCFKRRGDTFRDSASPYPRQRPVHLYHRGNIHPKAPSRGPLTNPSGVLTDLEIFALGMTSTTDPLSDSQLSFSHGGTTEDGEVRVAEGLSESDMLEDFIALVDGSIILEAGPSSKKGEEEDQHNDV